MYQYPYGNAQQLNLDWILGKIKELEEQVLSGGSVDLEEIANALISASYAVQNYNRSDIVFYDGKLYRANQNITAEAWDSAHWDEILLGDTVANLVRYIGSLDNSQVFNISTVAGTHTSDALNNLASNINDLNDEITKLQEVNVLVVGNSFNQDMMAYLPPIMNEALPEFKFNWCLLYEGSSDFDTHIQMFIDGTKYTYTNIWEVGDTAWHRYPKTDPNGMTLKEALAYKHWDMVFMQATTSDVQSEALIQSKVITAGRRLMRAVAAYASAPFSFYTIEWLGRGETETEINDNYAAIHHGMVETVQALGFRDYVPVGTAFQNARTNSTIKALGTGISMLYSDNVHAQAGAPALLGNYVMAAFLCNICGKPNGIINSSFHPSTDVAIAINARTVNNPVGMTHGASSTITNPVKRAIQEIAYITLNNPMHITDCSSIVVNTPT